jgi:hypothetical protein
MEKKSMQKKRILMIALTGFWILAGFSGAASNTGVGTMDSNALPTCVMASMDGQKTGIRLRNDVGLNRDGEHIPRGDSTVSDPETQA